MDERARTKDLKRAHAEELATHEEKLSESNYKLTTAQETIDRLGRMVADLNKELAAATARVAASAGNQNEKLAMMQREHARALAERTRALEQAEAREAEARAKIEWLVQEHALVRRDDDNQEQRAEIERLKELVHELKHENADKEVKIVQLTKARTQDKEDLASINIALDSKQQELELVSCFLICFLICV
jgi:sugar phosphate isomerase/epimerase